MAKMSDTDFEHVLLFPAWRDRAKAKAISCGLCQEHSIGNDSVVLVVFPGVSFLAFPVAASISFIIFTRGNGTTTLSRDVTFPFFAPRMASVSHHSLPHRGPCVFVCMITKFRGTEKHRDVKFSHDGGFKKNMCV